MQKLDEESSNIQLALHYVVCYGALFLFGAVCMWLLVVTRTVVISLGFWLQANPWQIRAIDTWGTFLLGLGWLVAFMVAEGYLRQGVRSNLLARRILRIFSLAAVYAVTIHLINWIL